ncbi:hypothetical protein PARA125_001471 [Parachlamydia sp. AcF125]|nr:hypothetical protein [Parachlamydia sp. AcF125]
MKFEKHLFIFTQLLCVCASAWAGQDKPNEEPQEERVHLPIGERAEPHAERVIAKEARHEVSEESEETEEVRVKEVLLTSASIRQEISFGDVKDPRFLASSKLPKFIGYCTTHQGVYRHPYVVSFDGGEVELNDGSIWLVCSSDRYKTLNWLTSDRIIVTPNSNFFSSYDYSLVNLDTNVIVPVNLFAGPLYRGIYTYFISDIDYVNSIVYLNDGSSWKVCWLDSFIFDKWLINDTLILGVNNDPLCVHPNILLNVNRIEDAGATCLN